MKHSVLLPLLRLGSGSNYTGQAFNRDLRKFLGKMATAQGGTVPSHSFRSGITTSMAAMGYQEIMAMGRWHSSAFLHYIKAPREKRAMVATELASRMFKLAECQ